jgi:hypothetical protein
MDLKLKLKGKKLTLRDDITSKEFSHSKFSVNASKLIYGFKTKT